MTIYDVVTSSRLVAYWEQTVNEQEAWLFEELFDSEQKLGVKFEAIKGKSGVPKVLNPSAYDVKSIPRPRIGAEKMMGELPFFKEDMYVDEELRQMFNIVLETQNTQYVQNIMKNVFNDEISLLIAARAQRERMRAQAVTTGAILVEGNGQIYEYDYQFPENHKATVTKSWSDPTSDIIEDIRIAQETVRTDTGEELVRAICSSKVFGYFRKNEILKQTLLATTQGKGNLGSDAIKTYFVEELGLEIVTYDKMYKDENDVTQRYVPDDIFVMIPGGLLGTMLFGTTPEQSDLMAKKVANVSITDVGVAVTTSEIVDPVTVDTKVTQICLPILPTSDSIFIYDVIADAA